MHDQPTPAQVEDQEDAGVLELLMHEPLPWSLDEIARELGDRVVATDAVARLYAAGLVHRFGEFVFATRAARRGIGLSR